VSVDLVIITHKGYADFAALSVLGVPEGIAAGTRRQAARSAADYQGGSNAICK
jgi:hypothetical protein